MSNQLQASKMNIRFFAVIKLCLAFAGITLLLNLSGCQSPVDTAATVSAPSQLPRDTINEFSGEQIRAQLQDSLRLATQAQRQVEYNAQHGYMYEKDWYPIVPTENTNSIAIHHQTGEVTIMSQSGIVLVLTPVDDLGALAYPRQSEGTVQWSCKGFGYMRSGDLPPECVAAN